MDYQEEGFNTRQMEYEAMLQNYDTSGPWTDFSLYENDQTYINHENSLKPILSAATFPQFETLTSTYNSTPPSLSPMSSMSMSLDDFYPHSTFDSPFTKEQSPPLSESLHSIPVFYDLDSQNPAAEQEESAKDITSTPERTSSKVSKRRTNAKASKAKAPASPSSIERRRQQNRASQMAFRERTKKLVEDLRRQLVTSEAERLRLKGMLEQIMVPDIQRRGLL